MGDGFGIGLGMAAIAISCAIWAMFDRWIKYKEGQRDNSQNGAVTDKIQNHVTLLSNENGELNDKMLRLEDRIAVLERIATDPAKRTALEIENLRT